MPRNNCGVLDGDQTFSQVIPNPNEVMGVKAIWGRFNERVLCFGARTDPLALARSVATRSKESPFVIAVGGGKNVLSEIDGRVATVAKVTATFGFTKNFISDPSILERLAQWPVSVALLDVYDIEGSPHLVHDLGFKDKTILANAFDNVVRPPLVDHLWHTLANYKLCLRDLPPLLNFRVAENVAVIGTRLPKNVGAQEGEALLEQSRRLERNAKIARAAKETNRERNSGIYACDACGFRDLNRALFDAHHLVPLAIGQRFSTASDFAILCPSCHRIAHTVAAFRYDPLTPQEVATWLATKQDRKTSR